jgi:hypothetical protein
MHLQTRTFTTAWVRNDLGEGGGGIILVIFPVISYKSREHTKAQMK